MREASEGVSHSSLLVFGRSGLRPSLVRGDTPRNAPDKNTPRQRRTILQPLTPAVPPAVPPLILSQQTTSASHLLPPQKDAPTGHEKKG